MRYTALWTTEATIHVISSIDEMLGDINWWIIKVTCAPKARGFLVINIINM
jgi:hypothetical protein